MFKVKIIDKDQIVIVLDLGIFWGNLLRWLLFNIYFDKLD